MKSREGTVVDADDLMEEVIALAKSESGDRGELDGLTPEERNDICVKIGLSALKYHILKVSPKKAMVFDPKESLDMHGTTGPYIQNAYVRIAGIFRKNTEETTATSSDYQAILPQEKDLLSLLQQYPSTISIAARDHNPADICTYSYVLAKAYHRFYHDVKILGAEHAEEKAFRIRLSQAVAQVLTHSMGILGIELPERM
jgi:arginyl-tRNA synthetase